MKKTSFETLIGLKTNLHGKSLTNTTLSKIAIEVHKNKKKSAKIVVGQAGGGPFAIHAVCLKRRCAHAQYALDQSRNAYVVTCVNTVIIMRVWTL